ncbi:hypothetical protein [Crystallibacter degradans]|uniref:hypothetical protein n=1 Tax=Crystallibacter degradans TaxID=2726743 RepID=UPI001474CCFE|nr:hypothetical protein [Arthrobacter sp. SF27]NMR31183.1 hypothetical protein [Arthrobacter sp. SF27]
MKATRTLWLLSFLAGFVAIVFAYLSRDARLEWLRALAAELGPDQDSQTLDAVAALAHWGSLGVLVLIIVIEALLLRPMMRQRGWVRWVQLGVLLSHGGAAVLADAVLVAPGGGEDYLRLLLGVQLVLAAAALVISVLPGASNWFSGSRKRNAGRAADARGGAGSA